MQIKKWSTILIVLTFVLVAFQTNFVSGASKGKIKKVTVTNIKKGKLTLKEGQTKKLKVKVTVSGKISKKVSFQSKNKKIAKVSSKGTVKAMKAGKTTIIVASKKNKKKKAVVKVTVKAKSSPIKKTTEKKTPSVLPENYPKYSKTISSNGGLTAKVGTMFFREKTYDNYTTRIMEINGGSGRYNVTVNHEGVRAIESPGENQEWDYNLDFESFKLDMISGNKIFEIPITVTDVNDHSKKTSIVMYVVVLKCVKVSAKAFLADGSDISDLVEFYCFTDEDTNQGHCLYANEETVSVPIGESIIYASVSGSYSTKEKITIKADGMVIFHTDLNRIKVSLDNLKYRIDDFYYWTADGSNQQKGKGADLFLKNGTYYNLTARYKDSNFGKEVLAKIAMLKVDSSTKSAVATVSEENYSAEIEKNSVTVKLGEMTVVERSEYYECVIIKFIPQKTGMYQFECYDSWVSQGACLDEEMNSLERMGRNGGGNFYLEQGKNYYFLANPVNDSTTIRIVESLDELRDLTFGEEIKRNNNYGGNNRFLRFVPTETGTYTFYSEGDYDPEAFLYDIKGNIIAENDDISEEEENLHFKITCELKAGETYFIEDRFVGIEGNEYTLKMKKED